MDEKTRSKRRYSRVTLPQPIGADVTARYEVRIMDLSLGGARLEHTTILRPGDRCYLRFQLTEQMMTITSKIVWSNVVGRAEGMGSALLFQTGLAFEGMPEATSTIVSDFLRAQSRSHGDGSVGWVETTK